MALTILETLKENMVIRHHRVQIVNAITFLLFGLPTLFILQEKVFQENFMQHSYIQDLSLLQAANGL
jgi:BarA-like signal transduction histidine kinase